MPTFSFAGACFNVTYLIEAATIAEVVGLKKIRGLERFCEGLSPTTQNRLHSAQETFENVKVEQESQKIHFGMNENGCCFFFCVIRHASLHSRWQVQQNVTECNEYPR